MQESVLNEGTVCNRKTRAYLCLCDRIWPLCRQDNVCSCHAGRVGQLHLDSLQRSLLIEPITRLDSLNSLKAQQCTLIYDTQWGSMKNKTQWWTMNHYDLTYNRGLRIRLGKYAINEQSRTMNRCKLCYKGCVCYKIILHWNIHNQVQQWTKANSDEYLTTITYVTNLTPWRHEDMGVGS